MQEKKESTSNKCQYCTHKDNNITYGVNIRSMTEYGRKSYSLFCCIFDSVHYTLPCFQTVSSLVPIDRFNLIWRILSIG